MKKSAMRLKKTLEKEIRDITATDLQDEIIGPIFIEEYREQVSKRMKNELMRSLAIIIDLYFKILKVISEQKLI